MSNKETLFDKFWESSSLDSFNVVEFFQKFNSYDSNVKELSLEFPKASQSLPQARTKLNKISQKRKSDRAFSDKQLTLKEFGRLLSSFYAWNGLEHRGFPSAGATYVTEVFCVAFNVEKFTGKIIYYDSEKHGVVTISKDAPSWEEASQSLNMSVEGAPSLLLLFVAFPERATAKYGDRGGRFALLEVGAAMQQLSLQIAELSKIKGVIAGGVLDEAWKKTLKLQNTNAKIVLGYLIGK